MYSKNSKSIFLALVGFYFIYCIRTPENFHIIGSVNLVIHEAGHFIFMFLGEFMHVLGGSLTQILIPIIFAGYFFLQRDIFSGGIVSMWVGQNFVEVSRYAGDAVFQRLQLLGGDGVIHDWNWLLSTTHLLKYTSLISNIIYSLGIFILIAGILLSLSEVFKISLSQK